jgi:hypothetical protein
VTVHARDRRHETTHPSGCSSGDTGPAGRPPPQGSSSSTDAAEHIVGDAYHLPIDGVLDLHTFLPGEIKDLIPEYVEECRRAGILRLRIIHGKGTGALRRTVHAVLARLPEVNGFRSADESGGGWGATVVDLQPAGADDRREHETASEAT